MPVSRFLQGTLAKFVLDTMDKENNAHAYNYFHKPYNIQYHCQRNLAEINPHKCDRI